MNNFFFSKKKALVEKEQDCRTTVEKNKVKEQIQKSYIELYSQLLDVKTVKTSVSKFFFF